MGWDPVCPDLRVLFPTITVDHGDPALDPDPA